MQHTIQPGQLYRWARQKEVDWEAVLGLSLVARVLRSRAWWNPWRPLPAVGGNPALHAVEPDERDFWMELGERVGHTLVLGTTRVGKTRLAEVLITQVIRRKGIVYVGLDALTDTTVASAVGNSMFADLVSVAASSAFPSGFSALTLNNYPNECGYQRPDWVSQTLAVGPDKRPILHGIARNWATYEDDALRAYIHLIDGGVADNLGTRSSVSAVVADIWRTPDGRPLAERIRRFIVIIVNAVADPRPGYDREPGAPVLFDTLLKAGTSPLDNYTTDTVVLIKLKFDELDKLNRNFAVLSEVSAELAAERCGNRRSCREAQVQSCTDRFYSETRNRPPYPELHLVHVRFNLAKDPALRARLREVPTSLQLPREQDDLVVNSAATLLEESVEFQRLLGDLSAHKQ